MLLSKTCIVASSIPPIMTGAGRRMYNQAKYLANSGIHISIITNTDNHNGVTENLDVIVIKLPFWFKNKEKNAKALRVIKSMALQIIFFIKLFNLLKKSRFELIHIVNSQSRLALPAILVAKLKNIKVINCTTSFDSDDPVSITNSRGKFGKVIYFQLPDAIINNSPALLERCKKAGLPDEKCFYIPNPVNTKQFKPISGQGKKALLKKKFGLCSYKYVFLTVSLIKKDKNIEELVQIFRDVEHKLTSCCLIIVGSHNHDKDCIQTYTKLKDLVSQYGLDEKVLFPGTSENINELMNASDIFFFASKREGMPNVLLEAMSAGMPIIVKELEYVTDTLFAFNNGIVVKDKNSFKENIFRIITNQRLRKTISDNARMTAERLFSNEVVMGKYIETYKTISNNVFVD